MVATFSRRAAELRASEVRELLKMAASRHIISFGAGRPPDECLPIAELSVAVTRVLAEHGVEALQYSTTEGCEALRAAVAARMRDRLGINVSPSSVLVTTGSQQGIDLTGRVFLDEGDAVFCESPTYLAALNALRTWRPRFVEVPSDDDGMIVSELETRLATTARPKLIYVIPDFQNPSGRTWSLARRLELIEVASHRGIPIVEDSPYAELRFEGEGVPPIKALDRSGLVIFMSTFSKILSPGLRVGWLTAEEGILQKYVLAKQSCDLHTPTLNQLLVATYLSLFDIERHIEEVRHECRRRRDAMVRALGREFGEAAACRPPQGGLFLWVELPPGTSARDLLCAALRHDVAFPPGDAFFPNGGHANTLRLAFSDSPPERIDEGIRRLAQAFREVRDVASRGVQQAATA